VFLMVLPFPVMVNSRKSTQAARCGSVELARNAGVVTRASAGRLQTSAESGAVAGEIVYQNLSGVGTNVWCRPRVVALDLDATAAMVRIFPISWQKSLSMYTWTVWMAGVMNANMASA
jgi:hypothetical protein